LRAPVDRRTDPGYPASNANCCRSRIAAQLSRSSVNASKAGATQPSTLVLNGRCTR